MSFSENSFKNTLVPNAPIPVYVPTAPRLLGGAPPIKKFCEEGARMIFLQGGPKFEVTPLAHSVSLVPAE